VSQDKNYPIVMRRRFFCVGQCRKVTDHHSVIYPDSEANTCLVCSHKQLARYDRESAVVVVEADAIELEGISNDLNELAGELKHRKWGLLGKKDKSFIDHTADQILAIKRRADRVRKRE